MSKPLSFWREILRNYLVYQAQIFRDNWNCYAFSIFRVVILIAWSSNESGMFMQPRSQGSLLPVPTWKKKRCLWGKKCKQSFAYWSASSSVWWEDVCPSSWIVLFFTLVTFLFHVCFRTLEDRAQRLFSTKGMIPQTMKKSRLSR